MKILIIGPFPEPISGVSLANKVVYENLPIYHKDVQLKQINTSYISLKEDIGEFNIIKVWVYIKQYIGLAKVFSCDKLYYTTGQTFFGVLKYLPYLLIAKFLRKEIIVHIHGNFLHQEYKSLAGIKRIIFKKTLQLCDKGIVLSKSLRKNLTPFLQENKIFELENFVEDFLFEKKITKKWDKLRIICLSNLMTEKGIFDLLDSLKLLNENDIEFEAKIAGGIDATVEEEVMQKLKSLPRCVEYVGLVYGDDKRKFLNWGNTFVFPTYYAMEGQPISIFEAMATGNIILTTEHAGIPDVFKEEINGFYIAKKSPTSIASKLQIMSNNMTVYKLISERNIKEASEKYRVENFISKLNVILKYKK